MAKTIRLSSNNGSVCIRFNLNYVSHSLTMGTYGNHADMAKMQRIAEDIARDIQDGTFRDMSKYRTVVEVPTVGKAREILEAHPDFLATGSPVYALLKVMQPYKPGTHLSRAIEGMSGMELKGASRRKYLGHFRKYFPQWKEHFEVKISSKGEAMADREGFAEREVANILYAFRGTHYASLVNLSLATGMRPAEVYGLRWCDIQWDEKRIRIAESLQQGVRKSTKTGQVRYFPMNESVVNLLSKILSKTDDTRRDTLIFTNTEGNPVLARTFIRVWQPRLKTAGVRYRPPYTMRHTFISTALAKGVPVATVAAWVGNTPEVIWKHYATGISDVVVPDIIGAIAS